MNKPPAFQFYPKDWLSSSRIALMKPEHEGAYIRLLCHDWENDGIPENDDDLALLSRLGEGWFKGGSEMVKRCFDPHPSKPGFLTNERLQKERRKQAEWRRKSSDGGKKSSESRRSMFKGGSTTLPTKPQPTPVKGGSSLLSASASASAISLERAQHFPEANGNPTLAEVKAKAEMIGLAEWKAEDWFNEMQGCGWLDHSHRPIVDWVAVMTRVRVKWESDGRPKSPPKSRALQSQPPRESGNF